MKLARITTILGFVLVMGFAVAVAAEVKHEVLPSGSVNYKMTVTVETPEGIQSGSVVRKVTMGMMPNMLRPGNSSFTGTADVKGEAVVVDLGKRGKLFALLRGSIYGPDYAHTIFFKSFAWHGGNDYGGALSAEGIKWYLKLKKGKKVLEPYEYPDMVMFKDSNDPKTVQSVFHGERDYRNTHKIHQYEDKITDNTEALFGKDIKIKNVTIEVTQEPVITRIKRILPWLESRKSTMGYLGGPTTSPFTDPSKTYLNGSEFISGEKL